MNARSALFDLYGDHLARRGSRAPVASLVRLLAPLGITEPAARTAVSRMVRQGWLTPVRCGPGLAGYALTPRAASRLDEAAERIYRRGDLAWDGQWHVLVVERIRDRARRGRVRAALGYLGYAPLDETTWISPRPSVELDALLEAERLRAERFLASYDGDAGGLLARTWDLDGLARAYQRWLAQAHELIAAVGPDAADPAVFALRSSLVHEWRKFLFTDPGFPAALLPPNWPGHQAARVFQAESARLLPGRVPVRGLLPEDRRSGALGAVSPGHDAAVHLGAGADDLLGDLHQVGGHLLGLTAVRRPPPDRVAAAPHGQPIPDREHRHALGRLLGAEETTTEPALDEHLLQRPGRPSWRQAGAPQRLRHDAGRHGLREPHRLSGYLPATEPRTGQVLPPPPGRQPSHYLKPAPAHRVGSGSAGHRRQVVLPAI